ncbi:MAG: proline--tRNA ligase, partial [Chloroflexi bacterium]|nr:proline--tRNA ligase [Chloroflexota bacterium]
SHEFILLADAGEDTIIICPQSHYYANAEKAVFQKPEQTPEDPLELEEVHTPGVKTIAELAEFLDVPTSKTLKAVFYSADGEVVFVVIRGDLEVNEVKLNNALGGVAELRLATPDEVRAKGLVAGSASPIGLDGIRIIADDSINMGSNFVVGANRQDYHLRNSNHPRDFKADVITDIALAEEGFACPLCGEPLTTRRGIEVGHVFKLGTRYSEVAGAYFPDQNDVQRPIIMGCYGIGVGRLLAAAIEQHHDDKGMILPTPLAPYDVSLIGLNVENPDVANAAEDLYGRLTQAGIDVLYDDRSESPGVKFNDADLLGLPVRLVVSPRNLKQNVVEVKRRSQSEAVTVPPDEVVAKVRELLES